MLNKKSFFGLFGSSDDKKLSEEVSTLILTVRPQDMGVVLKDIENYIQFNLKLNQ